MINLRYHIVSLVAVFLALGVGIVVGSTVVARGEVTLLQGRLDAVDQRVTRVDGQNRALTAQLDIWDRFVREGQDQLLAGRLADAPVLTVAVRGVDRKGVDGLRRQLADARSRSQGTIWLTPKLRLDSQGDADALAAVLGQGGGPDVLRAQAIRAIAGALIPALPITTTTTAPPSPDGSTPSTAAPSGGGRVLPALRAAGFIDYEGPDTVTTTAPPAVSAATVPFDLTGPPLAGTRLIVVGGAGAAVADDVAAVPLTRALSSTATGLVVAESGQDTPGGREVLVGSMRKGAIPGLPITTVDNLESFMGQAAVILALGQPPPAKAVHYGVGPQAQRLLPLPPQS